MFLKQVTINNFRGIDTLTVFFKKGVNVIIGENNSFKTTVLDALRICFQSGDQYKELFLSPEDFHINKNGEHSNEMKFTLHFSGLSDDNKSVFIELLSVGDESENDELVLHLSFSLIKKNGVVRIRPKITGGSSEITVPQEVLELIYHVHLDALRDAGRRLSPNRGNRIGQLFTKIVNEESDQAAYAEDLNSAVTNCSRWNSLLDNARGKINEHLKKTTIANMSQYVDVNFVPLEFKRIVEGLKLIIPFIVSIPKSIFPDWNDAEYGQYFTDPSAENMEVKPIYIDEFLNKSRFECPVKQKVSEVLKQKLIQFDLSQNGLGYNNLIYISTVLGDIIQRATLDKDSYVALLIEEPEAHLHPQLQNILFEYFRSNSDQIQIFITSHSPTITSKADIDTLIVMQNHSDTLSSIPISHLPICSMSKYRSLKKQLERFLDVTKCQLFFARGIILVEGISEALLLPIFSEIMSEQGCDYNLDRNAVEVVNIGGVSFKQFGLLFNSGNINSRLNSYCSIITDDDRGSCTEPCRRAQAVHKLEAGNLKVCMAEQTFEYELYMNNEAIIKSVCTRFKSDKATISERALEFVKRLSDRKQKAVFAQRFAEHLSNNPENFVVPEYIQKAIKWAVRGE